MKLWLELGLAGVALVLTAANALTTRRLWTSAAFERSQKIAQSVLIWLLPGSFLVVRHFLGEPRKEAAGDPTIFRVESYDDAVGHHREHGGGGHDP